MGHNVLDWSWELTTNLLIFSPSHLHQSAWRALLAGQPGISVLGASGDPQDLAAYSTQQSPAVLVDLPSVEAERVIELAAATPQGELLILVDRYDLEQIISLLRAGATGILSRDASVGDLARAIIATGRGELTLPPEMASQALVALARGDTKADQPSDPLTERETEVLNLLAQGLTNKDIAQELILSVRTVEAHLRNIFSKLAVGSRTEAALWAVNHGYGSSAKD